MLNGVCPSSLSQRSDFSEPISIVWEEAHSDHTSICSLWPTLSERRNGITLTNSSICLPVFKNMFLKEYFRRWLDSVDFSLSLSRC